MNENKTISKTALIISNMIPIFGVLFFAWNVGSIIFLYWTENIIIGILNVVKMLKSKGEYIPESLKNEPGIKKINFNIVGILLIPFFIFHYGMFTMVHGIFVFTLFNIPKMSGTVFALAFASMLISHIISYKTNFIDKGEYLKISPQEVMIQPYKRVMVMHLTIIFGGFLVSSIGQPIAAIIVMVLIKIIIDLKAHNNEHYNFNV